MRIQSFSYIWPIGDLDLIRPTLPIMLDECSASPSHVDSPGFEKPVKFNLKEIKWIHSFHFFKIKNGLFNFKSHYLKSGIMFK